MECRTTTWRQLHSLFCDKNGQKEDMSGNKGMCSRIQGS